MFYNYLCRKKKYLFWSPNVREGKEESMKRKFDSRVVCEFLPRKRSCIPFSGGVLHVEQVLSLRLLVKDLWEFQAARDLEAENGNENRATGIRIAWIMEFLFGGPTRKLSQNNSSCVGSKHLSNSKWNSSFCFQISFQPLKEMLIKSRH